jgi:hypothetical protein
MEPWIQTKSGRQFWPLNPSPDDVDLDDIAHALSMKCRYGGHVDRFYSVAEHSWFIAVWLLNHGHREHALWGLMHDASEAYLPDVARPIKAHLPGFMDLERGVMNAVCRKFAMSPWEPAIVKEADHRILHDERAALVGPEVEPWSISGKPLGVAPYCLSPPDAKECFLNLFYTVTRP